MKTLIVNGREFQYEVQTYMGEYGMYHETFFYEGYETYTRKKYYLFGDVITITQPKWVFNLFLDIESERYTKTEIRTMIEKKIELLERKKQIENGEII